MITDVMYFGNKQREYDNRVRYTAHFQQKKA